MKSESAFQKSVPHKVRILAVDDDQVVEQLLKNLLSEDFYFKHTRTISDFYNAFETFKPDIVLVDLYLPDGNGLSLCKTLLNSTRKTYPYFIIMTSDSEKKTVEKAYDTGVDDFIRKPFYSFELLSKIRVIAENINSRLHLKSLYDGVKTFNRKLYKLTSMINKNINEIEKSEILKSIEDVIEIINCEYCEVILFGSPNSQKLVVDSLEKAPSIPYSKLIELKPDLIETDSSHQKFEIDSQDYRLNVHLFRILFNHKQSGCVLIESHKIIPKESIELIQLYLDFINMKGTDFEIKTKLKIEIEKERKEIAKVRTIQVSMLPDFKDIPDHEIASSFIPMEEISGDFYDGFSLTDNIFQFVVCDVCGHGMPSSYIGSAIRSIIRSISKDILSLTEITKTLNEILTQTTIDITYFATLFLWQIDYTKCELKYMSAGHPEALLYENETGKIKLLESTGPLVGLFNGSIYNEVTIPFKQNDILFVYTDGLVEATEPVNRQLFKLERLEKEFLDAIEDSRPIDIIHSVLGAVYSFTDYGVVEDDVTIICMKKNSTCSKS
jgi:serine phosphatase RsbU (regulator of sigma subunit)/CheY-like chemotaxis protein